MQAAICEIFAQLQPGHTIITANRRLALYLHERYNQFQTQKGQSVWQTPDIIPYQSWLMRCYQFGLDNGLIKPELVINEQQELGIWEQLIINSQQDKPLLQVQATAREAKRAWQLLWEWQCALTHPSFQYHEDCLAFQQWAKEFQAYLSAKNWLEGSRLPERLMQLFKRYTQSVPSVLHWLGFLELTPQQQKLMALLTQQGCQHQVYLAKRQAVTIQQVACADPSTEIRAMARWAKALSTLNEHRIGCVVPNLTQIRAEVMRIFIEIFAPQLLLDSTDGDSQLPFNISAGLSLAEYPLIQAALSALQLSQSQIPTSSLMYLLGSPFFGRLTEHEVQIKLQTELNLYAAYPLSHSQLLRWLQAQTLKCHCIDNLKELLSLWAQQPKRQAPSYWAEIYSQQLVLLGWPGERALTSEEYQLQQKWQELLTLFASYDYIYPALSRAEAWQKLQQLAKDTIFQPEAPHARVQILGTLEATGQDFSHLWIMGLDDGHWPPKPAPNSFLPLALQRELQIPHASAGRETAFCKALLEHYYQHSEQVVLSYAQYEGEQKRRPSYLIQDIAQVSLDELSLAPDTQLAQQIHLLAELEYIELSPAPPLTESERIRGGTALFSSQAACPFKAFAEFRLGARALEVWELGLAPTERGNLLHQCLELLWQEWGAQQRLLVMTDEQLLEKIQQVATQAVKQLLKQRNGTLSQGLAQLEIQRLTKLLYSWLSMEKQRSPFEVVAVEQRTQVQIKGIPLTLRIDRLDRLASGEYVIIDYKSGKVSVDWETEQLTEPQLPIYCISSDYPIAAAVLAQVRNDGMKFYGLAKTEGLVPQISVAEDWSALLAHWQQALEKLATDFMAGHAAISPKDKRACDYCQLELVCRIKEKEVGYGQA